MISVSATAQRPNCSYNKGYIAYFYCACAKRPYFHFRSKIRRYHRVPRPRFPLRRVDFNDSAINKGYIAYFTAYARNGHISAPDLMTYSVDFFIGKAKRPPYFYFRIIWPTDLESVPRVEPPTLIISTKFEVDTIIHRRVTALVQIRYVTL